MNLCELDDSDVTVIVEWEKIPNSGSSPTRRCDSPGCHSPVTLKQLGHYTIRNYPVENVSIGYWCQGCAPLPKDPKWKD